MMLLVMLVHCILLSGTGASCVYPLLGAKKNKWKFLATELDATNFMYAVDNVKKNGLEDLIEGRKEVL
jgi:methyltransferase